MVGQISFLIGTAAFAALSAALLTVWRGRLGALFLAAVIATTLWCAVLALHARDPLLNPILLFGSELVRDVLWLLFLISLLRGRERQSVPERLRLFVHVLWAVVVGAGLLLYLLDRPGYVNESFVLGFFVMALTGLVLTEQVFRNTIEDQRWSIKFLCLALASVFVFDIVLYAKGLMFRGLDTDLWNARGIIHAMVVPLIAWSAARSRTWSADLFVSRRMAFYTTSIFGAGLYLLAMAAGGYYVRIWGGAWGAFAQAAFMFGAILLLLVTFFSGQVRARIKVFLNKHFFRYKYDYRDEWLRLTQLLSSSDTDVALRDRAIMSLANPVESLGGAMWLQGEEGQFLFAARWNMHVDEAHVEPSGSELVEFLARRGWVVDINEWHDDRTIYGDLDLPEWLQELEAAWLVVPLMRESGLYGFVVLAQSRAPQKLTWEDLDLLKTVGRHVAGYVAMENAAEMLAEASQFQAFNRFTAFIMHDLKNLIAQQSLVVRNAARHKNNPDFIEDAILTVDNSVRRMSRLLEQLRQGEAPGMASRISLPALCRDLIAEWGTRGAAPRLEIDDEGLEVRASRDRLAAVLGHIVRNAQDAAGSGGQVSVRLFRRTSQVVIEVSDDGPGMDEDFIRTRLFRPFESTKGSKGMGIGAYQAREFARSLGGDVEVYSIIGEGTRFRLVFPGEASGDALPQQQPGDVS